MRTTLILSILALAVSAQGAEFHVAITGSDSNSGKKGSPFRTIQHAAEIAQPGDTITVHAGTYRERINPPRGGMSEHKRITYQAAPGETVEIKGSEPVTGWTKVSDGVWTVNVPTAVFGRFNPYTNLIAGDWFDGRGRPHHTGAVYINGEWLTEAVTLDEVMGKSSPAWLTAGRDQYLLNVAWVRPVNDSAKRIPATSFAEKRGTQNAPCTEGGDCIGWIENGNWVKYPQVNFGSSTEYLEISVASATDGGLIEIRLDSPEGELLGKQLVGNTAGWQSWTSLKARIKAVSGTRSICLVFQANPPIGTNPQLWFAKVDSTNTTIWAQFKGINPNEELTEINARQTIFYPGQPGRNYITVRGFTMRHAATPWAPPTAEQIGLIGTHWSKGWIIESNNISHSICSGVALGKHGDQWDNTSANSAEGYVKTIERALARGWSKENIGHHIVRGNNISYCEQAGIVGSMGAVFSEVSGNTIQYIHVRRLFTGAEMAGIKFHAAIDVKIRNNHISRCCLGLWLDWMAQGTRVSGNLFHDNDLDLFTEVDHGPFVVDNNVFLSPAFLHTRSQGGAFAHNLVAGTIYVNGYDDRQTPFHKAHSTELAGMHDNPCGDDRWYNNIFVRGADLSQYDQSKLPVWMNGNVYCNNTKPGRFEKDPCVSTNDPNVKLVFKKGGAFLEASSNPSAIAGGSHKLVTSELLGKASVPNLRFENPDGAPLRIDRDYLGKPRNEKAPVPGPFELTNTGEISLKVW